MTETQRLVDPLLIMASVATVAVVVLSWWLTRAVRERWHVAKPNEWLLVVKDGKLKKSGIGISGFQWLNEQVVRFPSKVNKVSFKAEQVTKEMQGISVQGFVVWSIFRDNQGPFTAYKSLDGLDSPEGPVAPSESIARMAESIIRSEVANSTISEVISRREQLRGKIRTTMQDVVQGWGVWLETIEITDVIISSNRLFEDLQAEFRSESRRVAEEIRLRSERSVDELKLVQKTELAKMRAESEMQQSLFKAQQKLRLALEEAKLLQEQLQADRAQLEQQHELAKLRQAQKLEIKRTDAEYGLEEKRGEMKLVGEMNGTQQWKAQLDAVERAVKGLPLRDVKLVTMAGPQGAGPESLMTGLLGAMSSLRVTSDLAHEATADS